MGNLMNSQRQQSRRGELPTKLNIYSKSENKRIAETTGNVEIRRNHLNKLAQNKEVSRNTTIRKVFYPFIQLIMLVCMAMAYLQEPALGISFGAIKIAGTLMEFERGSIAGMNTRQQKVRVGKAGSNRYRYATVMYKAATRNSSNTPAQRRQRDIMTLVTGIASALNNKGLLNSYFKAGGSNGANGYQRWMSYHLSPVNNAVVQCDDGQAYINWPNIKITYGNFLREVLPYQVPADDLPENIEECDNYVLLTWKFDCNCDQLLKDACLIVTRIAVGEDGKLSTPMVTTTTAQLKDCRAVVNLKDNKCKKQFTYVHFSNPDATINSTSIYLGNQSYVPPVLPEDLSCCAPCNNEGCCDCKCEPPSEDPIFCGCGHPDPAINVADFIYSGGYDAVGLPGDVYHYPDKQGDEKCGCACYFAIVNPDIVEQVVQSLKDSNGFSDDEISFDAETGQITITASLEDLAYTVSYNAGTPEVPALVATVVNFVEGNCPDEGQLNRAVPYCLLGDTTEIFKIIEGSTITGNSDFGTQTFGNAAELLAILNDYYGGGFTFVNGRIKYNGTNGSVAGEDFVLVNSEEQNVLMVFNNANCLEAVASKNDGEGGIGNFNRTEEVVPDPPGE